MLSFFCILLKIEFIVNVEINEDLKLILYIVYYLLKVSLFLVRSIIV